MRSLINILLMVKGYFRSQGKAESHPFFDKAAAVAAVEAEAVVVSVEPEPEPEEAVERIGAALSPRYIRDPETGGLRRVSTE
jgi:hypothetical protein